MVMIYQMACRCRDCLQTYQGDGESIKSSANEGGNEIKTPYYKG